jgi:hypothetical protein
MQANRQRGKKIFSIFADKFATQKSSFVVMKVPPPKGNDMAIFHTLKRLPMSNQSVLLTMQRVYRRRFGGSCRPAISADAGWSFSYSTI